MLAQIVVLRFWKETKTCETGVYYGIQLPALCAELTVLTQEHAEFIVVEAEGPLKGGHYRYRTVRFSRWCCRRQHVALAHTFIPSGTSLRRTTVQRDC